MEYKIGEKVSLEIGRSTGIGIIVIINEEYDGLLYHNEIFQPLTTGQIIDGYIKNIREDGLIDVSLQPQGFHNVIEQNMAILLEKIKAEEGCLKLTDKSHPDEIQQALNMSKKAFKNAVGQLYKRKLITIGEDGIYLVI